MKLDNVNFKISTNRLLSELKTLVDTVRDPLSPVRKPTKYAEAYRDLLVLLSHEEIYRSIFEIQPGSKSNKLLVNLGKSRIEWLKRFHEDRVHD